MSVCAKLKRTAVIAAVAIGTPPLAALAQSSPDSDAGNWRFSAILYGYVPTIRGTLNVPFNASGPSLQVDPDTLLSDLNFAFMGTLDAHNGRWGMFTDVLYLDVSGDTSSSRNFTIGGRELPAGVSADLSLNLRGVIWTIAGEYRIATEQTWTVDALAGARLFGVKPKIGYAFNGDIGPLQIPGRSGSSSESVNNWDGIVGLKGEFRFGARGEWSVPLYVDIGTGDSDLTWQAAAGIGYSFHWGDILAMWRYLDYNFKSGAAISDIKFNGPMIGVRFQW